MNLSANSLHTTTSQSALNVGRIRRADVAVALDARHIVEDRALHLASEREADLHPFAHRRGDEWVHLRPNLGLAHVDLVVVNGKPSERQHLINRHSVGAKRVARVGLHEQRDLIGLRGGGEVERAELLTGDGAEEREGDGDLVVLQLGRRGGAFHRPTHVLNRITAHFPLPGREPKRVLHHVGGGDGDAILLGRERASEFDFRGVVRAHAVLVGRLASEGEHVVGVDVLLPVAPGEHVGPVVAAEVVGRYLLDADALALGVEQDSLPVAGVRALDVEAAGVLRGAERGRAVLLHRLHRPIRPGLHDEDVADALPVGEGHERQRGYRAYRATKHHCRACRWAPPGLGSDAAADASQSFLRSVFDGRRGRPPTMRH